MVYGGAMRAMVWALVLLTACGNEAVAVRDGALPDDACVPDLFGEACDLVVGYCRGTDVLNAKGACIDEGEGVGVCRPWACGAVPHCGVDLPDEIAHRCPSLCGREIESMPHNLHVCVPL